MFDGVAQEPVPEDFMDLLRKMDSQDLDNLGKKSS